MLCVEDALDSLKWAESIGGLPALTARSESNLSLIAAWVDRTPWAAFLPAKPPTRSPTSICLTTPTGPQIAALLSREAVAHDISSYREAPPGLRIWGGATINQEDIARLLPWLDWAHAQLAA